MKNLKRAQGAIEFVIIFSAFLFFFAVFFTVIKINLQKKDFEKERIVARSVVLDVQSEINLAAESSEGYYREFNIPENILGKDYEINNTDDEVYVGMNDMVISYKVSLVNGTLQKGINIIKKQDGNVLLN